MNKVMLSMQVIGELGRMVPFSQFGNNKPEPVKTIDIADAWLTTAACAALLRGIADEMDPEVVDYPVTRAMTGSMSDG